jgi:phosphoribosylformylglycinamidine synthase
VDGAQALRTYRALEKAIRMGLVRSVHDVSDGGMGVTLAESAFAGGLGAEIDLARVPQAGVFRDDYLLFSESQSRFVVTVSQEHADAAEKLFRSLPHGVIGKVTKEPRLVITGIYGARLIDADIARLKEYWLAPLQRLFG